MAKKNEEQKPPAPPAAGADKGAVVLVKVRMCVTAQGPGLCLMANHVVELPEAQAAEFIKAGAAVNAICYMVIEI